MEISERHSTVPRFFSRLLPVGLAVLACGCTQTSTGSTRVAADPIDRAPPEERSPRYSALPEAGVASLRATDFDLLRCSYRVDDRWYSLDCEYPCASLSTDAREELEAVLRRVTQPREPAPEPPRDGPPLRLFQLNLRERWIFDLEIADNGLEQPLTVRCVSENDPRVVRADAGHLSAEMRRWALETLLESGRRPRREPAWHPYALARLIEPADSAGERSAASRQLYERLVANLLDSAAASDRSRLAALLVPSVDLLTDSESAVLLSSELTAARILPLTRLAQGGDRQALYEIFRLAMEYGGDPAVFVAAARRLFPADLNPALVARHPRSRDRDDPLLLLATVRRSVEAAEYEPGHGWSLRVE